MFNEIIEILNTAFSIAHNQQNMIFVMEIYFIEIELAILDNKWEHAQLLLNIVKESVFHRNLLHYAEKININQLDIDFNSGYLILSHELNQETKIKHMKELITTFNTISELALNESEFSIPLQNFLQKIGSINFKLVEYLQDLLTVKAK